MGTTKTTRSTEAVIRDSGGGCYRKDERRGAEEQIVVEVIRVPKARMCLQPPLEPPDLGTTTAVTREQKAVFMRVGWTFDPSARWVTEPRRSWCSTSSKSLTEAVGSVTAALVHLRYFENVEQKRTEMMASIGGRRRLMMEAEVGLGQKGTNWTILGSTRFGLQGTPTSVIVLRVMGQAQIIKIVELVSKRNAKNSGLLEVNGSSDGFAQRINCEVGLLFNRGISVNSLTDQKTVRGFEPSFKNRGSLFSTIKLGLDEGVKWAFKPHQVNCFDSTELNTIFESSFLGIDKIKQGLVSKQIYKAQLDEVSGSEIKALLLSENASPNFSFRKPNFYSEERLATTVKGLVTLEQSSPSRGDWLGRLHIVTSVIGQSCVLLGLLWHIHHLVEEYPGVPSSNGSRERQTTQRNSFVLPPIKRLCKHQGIKFSHCNPASLSSKGTGDIDWIDETSEQNQDDFVRAVEHFAMELGKHKSKLKSMTNHKSSEILKSVSEEIDLQLQNVHSKIQIDIGRLTNLSKSKRKQLETKFEDQQKQLRFICDRFKKEVNLHLQDCRSTIQSLEADQIEIKGSLEKQRMSHLKLLMQAEEAVEIQLNDAQRKITTTHEMARGKLLQLKRVIAMCLKEGILN